MKLELHLNQRVYSKKNSKRMIVRGGKRFFVPSEAYERFAISAKAEIAEQLGKIPSTPIFKRSIFVTTEFHVPGNIRVDADNLHTSILDILQDARIIADDELIISGYYTKHRHAAHWCALITINEVDYD